MPVRSCGLFPPQPTALAIPEMEINLFHVRDSRVPDPAIADLPKALARDFGGRVDLVQVGVLERFDYIVMD